MSCNDICSDTDILHRGGDSSLISEHQQSRSPNYARSTQQQTEDYRTCESRTSSNYTSQTWRENKTSPIRKVLRAIVCASSNSSLIAAEIKPKKYNVFDEKEKIRVFIGKTVESTLIGPFSFLCAALYLEELVHGSNIQFFNEIRQNFESYFFACVILASKMFEDRFYSNDHFFSAMERKNRHCPFTLKQLNECERQICQALNYRFNRHIEDVEGFIAVRLKHM